jgi:uncharacterized protein (DUF1800 family)
VVPADALARDWRSAAAGAISTVSPRSRWFVWRWPLGVVATFLLWVALVAIAGAATTSAAPVFRFYNTQTQTHFYTISAAERDQVLARYAQFVFEGPVFYAFTQQQGDAQPVFRLFDAATGTHLYTNSADERDQVLATYPQFHDEGVAFYAPPAAGGDGRTELFRFYNNATQAHFYTTSVAERDHVISAFAQFVYEGVAFFVYPVPGAAGAPPPTVVPTSDAFRFLNQSSFGPTATSLARVAALGVPAFLEDQFAQPISGYPDSEFAYLSLDESPSCTFGAPNDTAAYACARDQLTLFKLRRRFFANALNQPDQLRQRVAWSLSQLLVISGMKDPDLETAYVQARYHQMLAEGAFDNFETLLTRVTLSPQMGHYLDMVDNAKADPEQGTEPNENFARELLQLFSIGLVELDTDGTPLLDANGQPIPTYGQAEIKSFARVFTGWTYPPYDAAQTPGPDDERYFGKPMVSAPEEHDTAAKVLLGGAPLPAGQTVAADLAAALHNVFMHPNVGPFIGAQLIRQLVTGNPSPAYVARVAAAFNDNGQGVRGDMKAVLRAILLDPEARGEVKADAGYGALKEPVLYMTSLLRALGAASDGIGFVDPSAAMGQDVFYSPSVFNYYPADYRIPGTSAIAPQFGIHNTNTVLARIDFAYDMVYGGGYERREDIADATGTAVDLTPFVALAASPAQLVQRVNDVLFGGGMTPGVQSEMLATVALLPADDPQARASAAVFLGATSFHFQVTR